MRKLQWLKTRVGLFSDPRMIYLLNQPNGDSYIVLWFFLKDMAGTVNDGGRVYVSEQQFLTPQLIAKCLHRRRPFIEKGLQVLEQLQLIERDAQGMITIAIWDELQDFQRNEICREQTKQRVRRYRERQRQRQETAVVSAPTPLAEETAPSTASLPEQEPIRTPQDMKGCAAVQHYEKRFGPMQRQVAKELADMDAMWGSEATCTAIDLAHENNVSHIKYIRAILVNSNGRPMRGKRKDDAFHGYENFTDYLAGVLRGEPEYQSHLHPNPAGESAVPAVHGTGEGTGQAAYHDA